MDLKVPLADVVRELASSERIVLLVDQLDALAALMDQKTGRLTVILKLVQHLKGTHNVHLLISCRQFDYRYDTRLASLKSAEVVLADPPFDAVRALLLGLGISTGTWPKDMCEMLRNPQHLNLFISTLAGTPSPQVFENYQAMIEAAYQARVIDGGSSVTPNACESIASYMSQNEELWVGRTMFDEQFPHEVDRLVAAGILLEDGRRIAFRHQTLFDYVRSRAFCSGTSTLSTYVLDRQDAIFVRPLTWAALHSLRACSFERYCAEMSKIWMHPTLRKHLRFLLISFLGQVQDPDLREAQWLLPLVDDGVHRGKALNAMVGSQAWFVRLQSRLPTLMAGKDQGVNWQLILILRAALQFDRPTVIRMISHHWSSKANDELVLQVFQEFLDWDEQTIAIIETILRRVSVRSFLATDMAQKAAKKGMGLGSRMIGASLTSMLQAGMREVEEYTNTQEPTAGEDEIAACIREHNKLDPVRAVIASPDWYGVEEVATAEPVPFVRSVFPIVLQVASVLASASNPRISQYRHSIEIELDSEVHVGQGQILQALKAALEAFGEHDPDGFVQFAGKFESDDLLITHRLLAYGFERACRLKPLPALAYVIADPRRLSLGGHDDQHRESRLLIAAIARQLSTEQLGPLERAVNRFEMYTGDASDDARLRWERRKWNRSHRLRLLRAFPADRMTDHMKKQRDEEEIALPHTRDYDSRVEGGFIGSPISAKQMARATDDEILNAFAELTDDTGTSHPRFFLQGGSYQASQAFASFAKEQPERALAIIERFEPGRHEMPAANAVHALADEPGVNPDELIRLVKVLSDRGFASSAFRDWSGWALQKLAARRPGLPEGICTMLKSWLGPATESGGIPKAAIRKKPKTGSEPTPHSLLWSLGGGGTLPHGNYPVLSALEWGYRSQNPPDIDSWLETVRAHLNTSEDVAVWSALVRNFSVFGAASDRRAALEFLRDLFIRYPGVLASFEGTIFLGQSIRWLPRELLKEWLIAIEASSWDDRDQAIGELTMLRVAVDETDEYCGSLVDVAIADIAPGALASRRVGIAYACVNLWASPSFRQRCHGILMRLVKAPEGHLPRALVDVFRIARPLPPDAKTAELLAAFSRNPELIRQGGPSFLIDRLKELLSDAFDPQIIAEVIRAVLIASGKDVGDVRTTWARGAGDLLEISITLQRFPQTRSSGLDVFEELLDLGAYEASQALRDLDRRPI